MQFKAIIGQTDLKGQMVKAVREGRIPHAQLFTGPVGVGKLQLAIAYAQYLACPNRSETDSCGTCPSCLQYQKLQHPDLHFAFPIVKDDRGDVCDDFATPWRDIVLHNGYFDLEDWYKALNVETKQGVIYEKESSEILRKLSLKSFSDGYKVMIIWQADKMNTVCANKLLKLLEEPPERTLFILISEHPEQMLTTILSRVQQIRVPRLTENELAAHFSADIAHIANGSYLAAKKLEDGGGSGDGGIQTREAYFDQFVALMRNAWNVGHKKDYAALQALRKWSLEIADSKVGRERQKAFLQYAQQQVRENYIYNLGHPEMNYQITKESQFSTRFAPFINENNVEKLMNELQKAEVQIGQNGNAKIIFFDLCLQMIVLIK
ncbi:MAG: DNA polymerase III subunit delta [Paludibacteraceae bacterium]|nr:DNA polymerase III subunit delta [Paludibacteraceae bacterium]